MAVAPPKDFASPSLFANPPEFIIHCFFKMMKRLKAAADRLAMSSDKARSNEGFIPQQTRIIKQRDASKSNSWNRADAFLKMALCNSLAERLSLRISSTSIGNPGHSNDHNSGCSTCAPSKENRAGSEQPVSRSGKIGFNLKRMQEITFSQSFSLSIGLEKGISRWTLLWKEG